jgi:hypothetical protein
MLHYASEHLNRSFGIQIRPEKATTNGRTSAAMRIAEDQRKARADLAGQRIREAQAMVALQVKKATADGERAKSRLISVRFAIWRPCSAPMTRPCCGGSFSVSLYFSIQPQSCCC